MFIREVLGGQRPLLIYGVVTQRTNPNARNPAERWYITLYFDEGKDQWLMKYTCPNMS